MLGPRVKAGENGPITGKSRLMLPPLALHPETATAGSPSATPAYWPNFRRTRVCHRIWHSSRINDSSTFFIAVAEASRLEIKQHRERRKKANARMRERWKNGENGIPFVPFYWV